MTRPKIGPIPEWAKPGIIRLSNQRDTLYAAAKDVLREMQGCGPHSCTVNQKSIDALAAAIKLVEANL